jgi:hypothetical protein
VFTYDISGITAVQFREHKLAYPRKYTPHLDYINKAIHSHLVKFTAKEDNAYYEPYETVGDEAWAKDIVSATYLVALRECFNAELWQAHRSHQMTPQWRSKWLREYLSRVWLGLTNHDARDRRDFMKAVKEDPDCLGEPLDVHPTNKGECPRTTSGIPAYRIIDGCARLDWDWVLKEYARRFREHFLDEDGYLDNEKPVMSVPGVSETLQAIKDGRGPALPEQVVDNDGDGGQVLRAGDGPDETDPHDDEAQKPVDHRRDEEGEGAHAASASDADEAQVVEEVQAGEEEGVGGRQSAAVDGNSGKEGDDDDQGKEGAEEREEMEAVEEREEDDSDDEGRNDDDKENGNVEQAVEAKEGEGMEGVEEGEDDEGPDEQKENGNDVEQAVEGQEIEGMEGVEEGEDEVGTPQESATGDGDDDERKLAGTSHLDETEQHPPTDPEGHGSPPAGTQGSQERGLQVDAPSDTMAVDQPEEEHPEHSVSCTCDAMRLGNPRLLIRCLSCRMHAVQKPSSGDHPCVNPTLRRSPERNAWR